MSATVSRSSAKTRASALLPCALGAVLGAALVSSACGGEDVQRPPPPPPIARPADAGAPTAAVDPLGPRPALSEPLPFTPPVPTSYKRENGLTVWLLERHSVPLVSMELVVSAGAAIDPEGKGGLAWMTANMLDEGAGSRGALDISRDVDRLGATLRTGAHADFAYVQITALKKNLGAAAPIFGDTITSPTMSAVEFKRVHDLWENALKQRQSEPSEVADVVMLKKSFPANHPYAHPADGTIASAAKVGLEDVKKLYKEQWRPDKATLVVVGDITRAELDATLDQAKLGATWKAPATPAAAPAPRNEKDAPQPAGRRVVIVDRADAPQSMVVLVRPAVAAGDADEAPLVRVNNALGGSFTSRLNQDLREEHGWSYGAHTSVQHTRLKGLFVAQAAVHTEHTGDAVKAMIADTESLAKSGLTDEEVGKTQKLARADLVEAFETVSSATARFARDAGLGLPPDHQAKSALATAHADKATLQKIAASYLDVQNALIVVVGPRAKIEPQIKAIGLTNIETSGPEGQ